MASFNRVILAGNITRDPEIRYLQNKTAVTDLGLAVNDKRKNAAGEWVEDVCFVDCTAFGRTAEVAGEYLRKGSEVLIEGRLKLDAWEAKDGGKRTKMKVIVDRLQMLGGKKDRSSEPPTRPQRQEDMPPWERDAIQDLTDEAKTVQPDESDIPF